VEVPFDVEEAFGSKRVKVKATIGGASYRGTLVRTPALAPGASVGGPNHILIILKEIREKIGKSFGDQVKVTVELDNEPRVVVLPKDQTGALKKDKEAKTRFGQLSYTHQKEYATWIEEAKKDETRQRRVAKTLERLREDK
jgi:hypothetical protein